MDGFFCVGPAWAAEPQTILELLNSTLRVIPFIVAADGSVILLTRLNLDWAMAGEQVESDLILPADYLVSRSEPVELEFVNGTTIDGVMQMEVTEERSRASDFLNGPAEFYPVLTRIGTLLVNKSRVRETRLSGTKPRPSPSQRAVHEA